MFFSDLTTKALKLLKRYGIDPKKLYVINPSYIELSKNTDSISNEFLRFFRFPMSPGYLIKNNSKVKITKKVLNELEDILKMEVLIPLESYPLQMVVDKNVWDFYKTVSELSYPVQVQLNITNKCINRCQMCRKYKWPQIDIPVAKLREIADELRRMETGLIILSGGEPFLHRDIERILDIFEDMTTLVFTSGVVPISVDKFKKLKKVQFSLDALAPELYRVIRGPGNVETVKENILKAKEAGCEVTVTTVIQKTNIFHVPDIIEFCEQEGIAFLPSVVHSYDELAFYNVKKRPLPPLCVVPFYHCLIDPAGDIFVCCHHHEDNTDYENIDRRFVLGNIFDCSFSEIWFSNKAKYIKRWLYNNRASFCNGCYRHLLENDVASFIRTCSTSVDLPFTHTYFFPLEMIASSRIFEHV